jgi:hypothetical protein
MIEPGTLTGEYVRTVRQRHKLTRQAFQDLCVQFGLNGGRSVARLCNIEAKDSWKTGDREAVARAIAQLEGDAPVTPTEAVADAFDLSDPHDPIFCVDPADDDDDSLVIVMAMPADDLIVPVVDAEDDEDDVVHVEPTDPWDEFDANGLLPIFEITNSNVQTFKRCRRKWWLTWYRGLARREEDMLGIRRTGSRIHQALQAYYVPENETPTDPRDALERALTEDWTLIKQAADARGHDEFVVADMEAKFRKTADLERAMIEGYVEWITETGCDAELRVIKSETQVSAPLFDYVRADGEVQPVHALGLLDVRAYRTSDGVRMFIDHKTVGDLKTPSMTLPQNEQMLHYHLLEWLSTSDGEERCDGALYNMLRRVKRTTSAKPPFYDRLEVRHNQHELESYKRRLVAETRDILRVTEQLDAGVDPQDVAYPRPTKDCTWDCDFFSICSMFDDGSRVEDAITGLYHEVDPNKRYEEKAGGSE